jgi:hypothetical protein
MTSGSRHGLVLVLDPDDAGQRAAESSGKRLLDLFGYWGKVRYPGEPTSYAVAHVQRAIDDLGDEIKALEALGQESLDQTEMRIILWDYMDQLLRTERKTVFSRATSAEELQHALEIEAAPLIAGTNRLDYAAIKREVDITSYVESFTGELRKTGSTLRAKCVFPDHVDKTASLYVYPETSSFYCFGCNRGGDVIEFAKLMGIPAREIQR